MGGLEERFTGYAGYSYRFINSRDGWLAFDSLEVTHDGGETWEPEMLAMASGCEAMKNTHYAPRFFDRERAVLAVPEKCNEEYGTTIYVTEDGGVTWSVRAVRPGAGYVATFATWFDVRAERVFVTKDGGAHWEDATSDWSSLRTTYDAPNGKFTELTFDFASATAGWALAGGRLTATADGGRTWELIYP